jgi:hypothetical protein
MVFDPYPVKSGILGYPEEWNYFFIVNKSNMGPSFEHTLE